MRATDRCLIRHLLTVLAFASSVCLVPADFGGSCYDRFNYQFQTCDEVSSGCSRSSCSSSNGDISYTCYSSGCSGTYTVSAATTATPTASSSYGMYACNSMYLSSCEDAEDKFNKVGCSCFKCVETNGKIEATCSSPFSCTPQTPREADDTTDAPEMGSKEYGVVCAVYILTAFILAGSAIAAGVYCFPNKVKGEPTIKETVAKKMPMIPRLIYKGSLASFVQDDGSPMRFVDYFCDKKELFGLIDWRKTTAKGRPRWMRGCAIITTLVVTTSLAFLLGTVVYNNESCVATHELNVCCDCHTWCGGVDLGCDGCDCKSSSQCSSGYFTCQSGKASIDVSQSTVSFACDSAGVETSNKANWVTMILTMVMAKAGSIAIGSAEEGSQRQKILHLATFSASIALIIFGVVYSNRLSKEGVAADPHANERRLKSIGQTLFTGWWYDQAIGFGAIISQFVLYWGAYYVLYQPMLEEAKRVGAAAVYPRGVQGLDDSIMKTEGVKGGAGKAVTIEEVTLQAPTQQQ